MPTVTVDLETPIRRTFRVEQVAGMLDLALEEGQVSGSGFQVSGYADQESEKGGLDREEARRTTAAQAGQALAEQGAYLVRHSLTAEMPGLDEEWTIGAIVGPSGSGKTTLARAAFGEAMYQAQTWPRDQAIIECLGELPIKETIRALTAVGLGSVPSWLKPYQVLSQGEQFRANLARALLECGRNLTRRRRGAEDSKHESFRASAPLREHLALIVFDEFTSSLDRAVAKTTSAALARLLRRQPEQRFVAVTCHADILPWLGPDWVLDLRERPLADASGWCVRAKRCFARQNRASQIKLRIERVRQALWEGFAKYHYLEGGLAASATCYGAFWEGEAMRSSRLGGSLALPIAFCAVVAALGWRGMKRITRLVTLPEFQGLGVGTRLMEEVAARESARGNRVTITASHPAIVSHCSRSPQWRYLGVKKNGSTRQRFCGREVRNSRGRAVASLEFVGQG